MVPLKWNKKALEDDVFLFIYLISVPISQIALQKKNW
jgi:hypothetical protein